MMGARLGKRTKLVRAVIAEWIQLKSGKFLNVRNLDAPPLESSNID